MSIDPVGDDLTDFLALAMRDPPAAARRLASAASCRDRQPPAYRTWLPMAVSEDLKVQSALQLRG